MALELDKPLFLHERDAHSSFTAILDRAVKDSERALALDPKSVDARLSLTVAIGMQGRRVSLAEAWRRGYAQRGKRLIAEAMALDPANARAIALQGSWNLEVLRRAGRAGGMMLGAGYDKGVAAFDRARATAPDDPGIALHYAIALLALDPAKHGGKARDLLAAASTCKASNAFDASLREEARRLGALLSSSGATAAAAMINRRYL